MRRTRWNRIFFLLLLVGVLVYLAIPGCQPERRVPSLLSELKRPVGIRFDPSFFFDRGVTARELARSEVARWHAAGVNAIFFRVYDPTYGASYRTNLPYNTETDYGAQDLLRHVLDEAHERAMKVYAWLPVLNHRGVWEAKPAWRALRPNGEPYTASSLPFPLCARQPGVAQWWGRFIDDLLDSYPDLDGIDVAEPAISWRAGEACHCRLCKTGFANGGRESAGSWSEYRSRPLVDLVLEAFRRARPRTMTTILTTVLPADADGNLLPFTVLRDRTGLDLERVLASRERPDYISVEFMWQEWAGVFKDAAVFKPAWVRRAFDEVRRRVAGRSRLIAHLELSDFGTVTVSGDDLSASLRAALEAGAEGIEVYEASLFDKKNAWEALAGVGDLTSTKRILILHDEEGTSDAWQLATLCGHFRAAVDVKPVPAYQSKEVEQYDALFYLGATTAAPLSEAFLQDVVGAQVPVLWLNANIQALLARTSRYGFIHIDTHKDTSFDRVQYRGAVLPHHEPHVHVVQVADPAKVQVLAELVSDDAVVPYVLKSGMFWYFADNPLSYALEGSSYVVVADLLHEVLGEDHTEKKLALVRLEDVHPLTPPDRLRAATALLYRRGIPFLIALVPFYVYPEKGAFVSLSDRPEFVKAVRHAVAHGATVVLHGVTHQRTAESTADYEFWDPVRDAPPDERTDAKTRARLVYGLKECFRNGIYPLLWETPHYAAPLADYRVISEFFSTACERRQSADKIGTDQLYPYVIAKDRFGQLLLPENLGYVPLDAQAAEPILAAARRTAVVRDATVGFFFHLFCELPILEEIADGLIAQGFSFPDVQSLGLTVKGPGFHVSTVKAAFPAEIPSSKGALLDRRGAVLWEGDPGDYPRDQEPAGGMRVFWDGDQDDRPAEESATLRLSSEGGFLVRPLQVGIVASQEEYQWIAEPFRAVAAPCRRLEITSEVLQVGEELTLVVVSEEAAASMGPTVRSQLINHAAGGGAVLTWGRTPLSSEAGVAFIDEQREVTEVLDLNYPGTRVRLPEPRRVAVITVEGDAEVLAQAEDEATALLIAYSLNDGTFLYSGVPPFGSGGWTPYPYLVSALESQCLLAPVCRAKRLEIYFDPGLRENVAVEDLIKLWSRHGVRVIHAGAWHEYPDWTYEYDRLIELAHQNGMLVNAWLVLPLVSPAFWEEHPQWHEKNYLGEDVDVDWRKAVALTDPACRKAVKAWLARFLDRFDFDGVTLAGLHFGGESLEHPESFSPFSEAAQRDFAEKHGFDPRELFDEESSHFWRTAEADLRQFLAWRTEWTTRLHREFLSCLAHVEKAEKLGLTVATVDAAARKEAADLVGVDTRAILKLKNEIPFTAQLMDVGEARPWSNGRVQSLLRDYAPDLTPADMVLHLDISRKVTSAPLGRLTGLSLYRVVASASPTAVAIYSEDSLPDADWPLLSRASASYAETSISPGAITVDAALGVRLAVAPDAEVQPLLNGAPWRGVGSQEILLPRGEHRVTFHPGSWSPAEDAAIVDCSCELIDVRPITRGIRFEYESRERACLVITREAVEVAMDGEPAAATLPRGLRGYPLLLPAGRHVVTVTTESWSSYALRSGSILLSGGIVAISVISLLLVGCLFLWGRLGRQRRRAVSLPGGGNS